MGLPIVNVHCGKLKTKFNCNSLKTNGKTCVCWFYPDSTLEFDFETCSFTGKISFEVDKINFAKIKIMTLFK
jgi:hypothetical protein